MKFHSCGPVLVCLVNDLVQRLNWRNLESMS